MDRASLALAQGLAEGVPRSLHAIADHGDVPLSTLHARARGRRSSEGESPGTAISHAIRGEGRDRVYLRDVRR